MSDSNGAGAETPYRRAAAKAEALDPWSKVLSSGPRLPLSVIIAVAAFFHVGLAAAGTAVSMFSEIWGWQRAIREAVSYRLSQYEMEVIKEPPPEPEPPPPTPEPEAAKPEPKDPPPQAAPPPAPAEAAKVLTADPEPNNAPVDLTNTFVQGTGSEYRGGTTSSDGTSKTAVYNPLATPTGVPGGTGTGPAPPPPRKDDKTRVPGLLGSTEWNCPWPGEADAEQIDHSYVMIQVKVKADGSPESVIVVQDPGHGFGREARKCAMQKKYATGLDADGNAVAGTTKPFRVRFDR